MINFNNISNSGDFYNLLDLDIDGTDLTDAEALNCLTTINLHEYDFTANIDKIKQVASGSMAPHVAPTIEMEQRAFPNNAYASPANHVIPLMPAATPKKISPKETAIVKTLPITPASKPPPGKKILASASKIMRNPIKTIRKTPKADVLSTVEVKKKRGRPRTTSLTTQLASSKFKAFPQVPDTISSTPAPSSTSVASTKPATAETKKRGRPRNVSLETTRTSFKPIAPVPTNTPPASATLESPPAPAPLLATGKKNSAPLSLFPAPSQIAGSMPQIQAPIPPSGYIYVPVIPMLLCPVALFNTLPAASLPSAVKPLATTNQPPTSKEI